MIGIHLLTKKKFITIFILIFLAAVILEIWASNRLSTFGEEVTRIETSKNSLTLENELLKDQIAKNQSLTRSEKYADFLGFQPDKNIIYVDDPNLALAH